MWVLGSEAPQQIQCQWRARPPILYYRIRYFKNTAGTQWECIMERIPKTTWKLKYCPGYHIHISHYVFDSYMKTQKHHTTALALNIQTPYFFSTYVKVRCLGLRGKEKQRSTMGRMFKRKGLEKTSFYT